MNVKVIVMGQPVDLRVGKRTTIERLMVDAKQKSGHIGNVGEWEARTPDGAILESLRTVKDVGLIDGSKIYVNPRAGVGGATKAA